MRHLRRRRILLSLAVAASLALGSVQAVAQTKADVDRAEDVLEDAVEERAFVRDELEAAIAEYQRINAELAELTYNEAQLRDAVAGYEAEVRALRDRVQERAISAYMSGGVDRIESFFGADNYADVVTSQQVLEHAASQDIGLIDQLAANRRQLERLREDLAADEARIAELRAAADEIVHVLDDLYLQYDQEVQVADAAFREAKREYEEKLRRERLAELARKQGAAAGIAAGLTPGFVCPLPGGGFINDWGFPRSGGRTHKGTDVFAPRGTPLLAVATGSIRLSTSRLGGTSVWLRADHGVSYYYAHLDGYAPGLQTGMRVTGGQVVGYTGDSGNARGGSPHLHFQLHPGHGSPVNPYPTLISYCR